MFRSELSAVAAAAILLSIVGCAGTPAIGSATLDTTNLDETGLAIGFETILADHGMATAGAAIIENGEIVWTGYFGEDVEGRAASSNTMFNVGSISKTIAAETALRLASSGAFSLDEPMAPYWVDPDVLDDPRHKTLTVRTMLTHRSGFPNWRYTDPEFKLRFMHDPNTRYGYSGEAFEYFAKFMEKKTQASYPELAEANIFEPLKLSGTSLGPQDWVYDRIAHPVDETGMRRKPFCTDASEWRCSPDGEWSAADELAITVEDYATFLIDVMNANGVSETLHQDRLTIQTSTAEDEVLRCALPDPTQCPIAQGYGLGWEIFEFEDATIVSHSGADWSERAMAYYDIKTKDGIVLFLNGPSSTSTGALIDGMNLLDPGSKVALLFEGWIAAYEARTAIDQEISD